MGLVGACCCGQLRALVGHLPALRSTRSYHIGRVACRGLGFGHQDDSEGWRQPKRPLIEHYARWDPKNRQKVPTPEAAERILQHTGRLPRPLRLSDVKAHAMPMKKSIVATPTERRKASEMVGLYGVSRLQARLLL